MTLPFFLLFFIQCSEFCSLKVHSTTLMEEAQIAVTRILKLIVQQAVLSEDVHMFTSYRGALSLIFMLAEVMTIPLYLWLSN